MRDQFGTRRDCFINCWARSSLLTVWFFSCSLTNSTFLFVITFYSPPPPLLLLLGLLRVALHLQRSMQLQKQQRSYRDPARQIFHERRIRPSALLPVSFIRCDSTFFFFFFFVVVFVLILILIEAIAQIELGVLDCFTRLRFWHLATLHFWLLRLYFWFWLLFWHIITTKFTNQFLWWNLQC